ncbi:nuclear transport factor 2 family protein [Nocardia sp. NBC_00508]|uniref:nuclear transport factor 2 family protein n=1 Tax=Nocardia sp. NBC_00508 TaxID=2975992 RepID=UPI002E7FE6CA|nr:nuclear transport factor 2 family protein [Nocardia sp. NBC_00508]WUD66536.1 nuclear transport factor 2 family protein [Nocardia sp. NBC_00508]
MNKLRRTLPILALPLALLAAACSTGATATEDDSTRRQLRELLDRHEIHALVDRLATALDEGRFDTFNTIYTADVKAKSPGGEAQGRDAVIALASRNHSNERRQPHYISNVQIDLAGDRAAVRANAVLAIVPTSTVDGRMAPEPLFAAGGGYRFDAVRTPEGWRFSRVETAPVWTTGTLPS